MNPFWKRQLSLLSCFSIFAMLGPLLTGMGLMIPVFAADITIQLENQNKAPLADAVIFMTSPSRPLPSDAARHRIEQIDKQFVPLVSAVPIDSVVEFPNHDHVKHHVYSFSAPKTFEIRLYKGADSPPVILDKPGVVTLGCNIHDFMVGYIYIVETPYYGVSNTDGLVIIHDLKAGEYVLKAWHPGIEQGKAIALQTMTIEHHAGENQARLTQQYQLSIKPEVFWKPQADETEQYGF